MNDGQQKVAGKLFKFSCPACEQHIQGNLELAGQQVDCPSCGKPIFVPPPKKTVEDGPVISAEQRAQAKPQAQPPTAKPTGIHSEATSSGDSVFPAPENTPDIESDKASTKFDPAARPDPKPFTPGRLRVAVLTPAVKSDIRLVRPGCCWSGIHKRTWRSVSGEDRSWHNAYSSLARAGLERILGRGFRGVEMDAEGKTPVIEPTAICKMLRGDILSVAGRREKLNKFERESGEPLPPEL